MDIQIGMPCKYELICTLIGWGIAIFIVLLIIAVCFTLLRKPTPHKSAPDKPSTIKAKQLDANHNNSDDKSTFKGR